MSQENEDTIKRALVTAINGASETTVHNAADALSAGNVTEVQERGALHMSGPFVNTAPTWVNAMP